MIMYDNVVVVSDRRRFESLGAPTRKQNTRNKNIRNSIIGYRVFLNTVFFHKNIKKLEVYKTRTQSRALVPEIKFLLAFETRANKLSNGTCTVPCP